VTFTGQNGPTDVGKATLEAVADLVKSKKLQIRVDVRAKDAATAKKRAQAVIDVLVARGVAKAQLTSTGTAGAEGVDFIKVKR
jgi:uncharacterized protein YggE